MKTLMIVESPAKAKKISSFLGDGYTVMASYGHIRDLPSTGQEPGELVVGVGKDYSLRYEAGSELASKVISRIKQAAKDADRVVLATDPDREGEAIAWHLDQVLRVKKVDRVTYQEVTEPAVRRALASPRTLDLDLVRAQEARRALDRMVGYAVSPVLSQHSGQRLSAGRVQTPALRLVVERERAIRNFKQQRHFGAELSFIGGWKAAWDTSLFLEPGQDYWLDQAAADKVAAIRNVQVTAFEDGQQREAPPAPFITSTLQQEAGKVLDLSVNDVMKVAQSLFDSGLITYHRTDSPNFMEDGQALIQAYCEQQGLPLAATARKWRSKAGAQEGHEAIRPVDLSVQEAGETEVERKLYALIRLRAIASQLEDAVYATRTAQLSASPNDAINGRAPVFVAKGRLLISQGWRSVYAGTAKDVDDDADEDEKQLSNPVPTLTVGQQLQATDGRRLDKKTMPPKRFTEAALIKQLESLGIGRPATYGQIITVIQKRSYVTNEGPKGKLLAPTPLGEALIDALAGKCSFADYAFTANIEQQLDEVAQGRQVYEAVIKPVWDGLLAELGNLTMQAQAPEHACPDCGKGLRRIKGPKGFFWGCSGYPDCKTTLPDERGKPGKRVQASTEHHCPKCAKPLIRRTKKGKDGFDFWGCTGFPDCRESFKPGADGKPVTGSK